MRTDSIILQVVLDTPLRRKFDYFPPAGGGARAIPGRRVLVPLGKRRAVGVIAAVSDRSELPAARLKRALEIIDAEPLWDPVTFALLGWAADYYHHPLGEVLFAAIPVALREGGSAQRNELAWRLSGRGIEALASTPRLGLRQQQLIKLIGDDSVSNEAISRAGLGAALKALAARGWLESLERPEPAPRAGPGRAGPVLTRDQSAACDAIAAAIGRYGCLAPARRDG